MVAKKKAKGKEKKAGKKAEEESEENSGGVSLDDAFADDEDVEYAKSKPKKMKKKDIEEELEEAEEEVEEISGKINGGVEQGPIKIKAGKLISKIKKGDRINVDGQEYQVDQHYVLIDHGTTKEMAIELFDKNDKDFQLRYFDDQPDSTLEFYELQEIMFIKKKIQSVEW